LKEYVYSSNSETENFTKESLSSDVTAEGCLQNYVLSLAGITKRFRNGIAAEKPGFSLEHS
jgi:hypothetical protein